MAKTTKTWPHRIFVAFMKRRSRQMRQQSQPKPLAAAERPVDLPARSHGAGDLAAAMRLECGATGCELEAKPHNGRASWRGRVGQSAQLPEAVESIRKKNRSKHKN